MNSICDLIFRGEDRGYMMCINTYSLVKESTCQIYLIYSLITLSWIHLSHYVFPRIIKKFFEGKISLSVPHTWPKLECSQKSVVTHGEWNGVFLSSMFLVFLVFLFRSCVARCSIVSSFIGYHCIGVWSALNLDPSRISGDNWTNLTKPSEYPYSSVS